MFNVQSTGKLPDGDDYDGDKRSGEMACDDDKYKEVCGNVVVDDDEEEAEYNDDGDDYAAPLLWGI